MTYSRLICSLEMLVNLMKKIIFIIIILITALVIIFLNSNIYFNSPSLNTSSNQVGILEHSKKYQYHFAVISPSIEDPFWQSVKQGAYAAAKELNLAVEFNGPRFTNQEEQLQYLDIAIAARVDGIAAHVVDEKRFTGLVDKAAKYNIPVVTIENDAKNSKRASFIGTNSYKLGVEWGKMAVAATEGKAVIAMILNDSGSEGDNTAQNLKVSGIRDAIKDYSSMTLKIIQANRNGFFSAEEVTVDILNQYTDVNTIICTSSKDTIGAAQVLVDFNKLGDVTLIGYDDTADILRYVEKGVIYGTVASNPYNMGYESISALFEIKKKNRTSAYINTNVNVITAKNVIEYRQRAENRMERDILK